VTPQRHLADGDVVIDASFVLALLDADPDAARFSGITARARITSVNLGEVFYVVERDAGVPPEDVEAALASLGVRAEPLAVEAARTFPRLKAADAQSRQAQLASGTPRTKVKSLSLGDLCCLGQGLASGLAVLTGDRHWTTLGLPIPVEDFRDPTLAP
jgi:PIN domain nuclease of toxin-antitoxin system